MKALLSLRFAYRHFRSNFSAMVLSMIAVALGVALVVAVRLMNAAVLQGFLDTADATAGRAAWAPNCWKRPCTTASPA